MFRLLVLIISISVSSHTFAQSSYQIDLIVFAHPKTVEHKELTIKSPMVSIDNIDKASFKMLKATQSELADQYYQLSRKSPFQVLGHYSWRQSAINPDKIVLPTTQHSGWQVQGSVQVRQSNYYLFDADLQVSTPQDPQSYFSVSQKQRLKANTVYFLDHPQIGMLVKIHRLS